MVLRTILFFTFSELFKKTISVSYLTLPEDKLNRIAKKFKENFFKIPNFKPIQVCCLHAFYGIFSGNFSNLTRKFCTFFLSVVLWRFFFQNVLQSIENSNKKRVLLDPIKIRTFEDISEEDRKYLEATFDVDQTDFGQISVDMSVDNFRPQVMLRAVLPTGEVEGNFEFEKFWI